MLRTLNFNIYHCSQKYPLVCHFSANQMEEEKNQTVGVPKETQNSPQAPPNDDLENFEEEDFYSFEGNEYEINEIVKHRVRKDQVQYLINWKDFSQEDNTWEPSYNIPQEIIDEYWEKVKNGQKGVHRRSSKKPKEPLFSSGHNSPSSSDVDDISQITILGAYMTKTSLIYRVIVNGKEVSMTSQKLRKTYPKQLCDYFEQHTTFSQEFEVTV